MESPKSLTRKQQEALTVIYTLLNQMGRRPTLDEIKQAMNISTRSTVHEHVRLLIKAGALLPGIGKSAYELPEFPFCSASNEEIPLLGRIAAGLPIQAIPDKELVNPNQELAGKGRFALLIKGESMVEIGIMDGDFVVIQPQDHADNGTVVAALIDGYETTLKRLYNLGDGRVELRPENRTMSSMFFPAESVQVQGKLVGVFRNWK